MDYIAAHLDQEMSLEELAGEAAFSPYHFHRLFTALTGESVGAYIRRLRLERAASHLLVYPERSVTETALRNGFASPAVFARAFRDRFGMSASAWRAARKDCKAMRKDGQMLGKDAIGPDSRPRYALPCWVSQRTSTETENTVEVQIEDMPALRAAYVRRLGPYYISACQAWEVLCRWAGPRGLLSRGHLLFSISHDDPTVTAASKLRYDACVAIDADTKVDDQVGVVELPARRVARVRYCGPGNGILGVYQSLYGDWLPESGFVPADIPAIEIYYPEEGNAPEKDHFVMDICMPIIPA